jgi:ribose 5-phosphate isomerase A
MRLSLLCVLVAGSSAFSVSPLAAFSSRAVSSSAGRAGVTSVRMNGMSPTDQAKKLAGYKAVDDHVKSGMVVGLGTGSTAYFAVERVGQKLASGELKDIVCIPTSERTREQAESLKVMIVLSQARANSNPSA